MLLWPRSQRWDLTQDDGWLTLQWCSGVAHALGWWCLAITQGSTEVKPRTELPQQGIWLMRTGRATGAPDWNDRKYTHKLDTVLEDNHNHTRIHTASMFIWSVVHFLLTVEHRESLLSGTHKTSSWTLNTHLMAYIKVTFSETKSYSNSIHM